MAEKLHYLFVCYANMDRSPTAEAVCERIAAENSLDIEASSAGTSHGANRPVTKKIADLADRIFVMQQGMVSEMVDGYGQNPAEVVCLEIPDIYGRNEPVLIRRLEAILYEHLIREGLV